MNAVLDRLRHGGGVDLYIANTFFVVARMEERLRKPDYITIRSAEIKYVLIPYNHPGQHWACLFWQKSSRNVVCLDSLATPQHASAHEQFVKMLSDEFLQRSRPLSTVRTA